MENILNTNLMIIRFYKNFVNDPIESLLAYHSRRYDSEDNLIDTICFASPSRCNMYGTNLTNIKIVGGYIPPDEVEAYTKISGFIDFLIYHEFTTTKVEMNKTLDDKDNFKRAFNECESIIWEYGIKHSLIPDSYSYMIFPIEENMANMKNQTLG